MHVSVPRLIQMHLILTKKTDAALPVVIHCDHGHRVAGRKLADGSVQALNVLVCRTAHLSFVAVGEARHRLARQNVHKRNACAATLQHVQKLLDGSHLAVIVIGVPEIRQVLNRRIARAGRRKFIRASCS